MTILAALLAAAVSATPTDVPPERSAASPAVMSSAAPTSEALQVYRSARAAADETFEGQMHLASVCRREGLDGRWRVHLLAAAELTDDREQSDKLRQKAGDRRVAGSWVDPEAARALDRIDAARRAVAQRSLSKVRRAFAFAAAGDSRRALFELNRVKGSQAPWLIAKAACDPDVSSKAQLVAVTAISSKDGVAASQGLAEIAALADWPGARRQAIDALRDRRVSDFVPVWLGHLHTPPTIRRDVRSGPAGSVLSLQIDSEGHHVRKRLLAQTASVYRSGTPLTVNVRRGENTEVQLLGRAQLLATLSERAAVEAAAISRVSQIRNYVAAVNENSLHALSEVTGQGPFAEPADAWNFWASYHGMAAAAQTDEKELVEVSEVEERVVRMPTQVTFRPAHECFAAGTPVWTPDGPRAIETIRTGDEVLSQDVVTGEVGPAVVVRPTRRFAREQFRLALPGETLVASGGHPLWEDGYGWRRVRHIEAGVTLAGRNESTTLLSVEAVAKEDPVASEPVYNLVVDGRHTYFVGGAKVLVHDDTIPRPVDARSPGRSLVANR